MMVTWIFATINRILEFTSDSTFVFVILHNVFSRLAGFFIFFVYVLKSDIRSELKR